MLTRAQQKAFEFIQNFIATEQHSPTVDEIANGIGIKSKGVAYRYVRALADAGLIRLMPNRRRNIVLVDAPNQPMALPLVGAIAAGQPIEAIAQQESVDLKALLGYTSNRYALKVKGDSMIEEGIFDGDIVICEHCDTANNGDIVVALIDNQEATLKRLQRNQGGTITLIPANAVLSPMVYEADRVQIQGRFIGLLRVVK